MKKLSIFTTLLISVGAFAQNSQGINEEHLAIYYPAHQSYDLTVKRIVLTTGVELEYAEQGDANGTPVIFLHGITDSWHSFESTLKYFPKKFHAFALSQRGHGDSERPAQGYTPKDFASDVAAFIRQKKLGPAVIVGHSMGGLNAQQFVLDYPQLTKAVVIVGSDPGFGDNAGVPEFFEEVKKMEGAISWEFMDAFQKSTIVNPIDSAYYHLLVAEGIKVPASVFKAAFAGLMQVDFTEALKKIRVPAAIFWGEKDSFCFIEGQEIMKRNISGAEFFLYENTGHALHWEQPERFANDLAKFIKRTDEQ